MAARGARAAGRAHAAHRRAHGHRGGRSGGAAASRGVRARAAATGLDRGPQRPHRHPLGREATPSAIADLPRNWSRSPRTSSWRQSSAALAPLLQQTRSIPIVFTVVTDPVGAGFVDSLARPGGNATGFIIWEYSIGGKWLELLKEIAPGSDAGGGPSRRQHGGGARPVRRDPGRGAVARRGVAPGRRARSRRDRAHHHDIRAGFERRPDRDG